MNHVRQQPGPRHPSGRAAGRLIRRVRFVLFGLVLFVVFVVPYEWMVASSFKGQYVIFQDVSPLSIGAFIPRNITFDNFVWLQQNRAVLRALLNSAIVAVAQVAGTVIISAPAAYAMSRMSFRGRNVLFLVILLTFMVPTEALIVPMYSVVSGYGLSNNLAAVFLPWVASPFALFLLRQAFDSIPRELDEAAVIDGASHWQVFRHVILPNATTALATVVLVTFLFSWNAFLWPLVILQSPDLTVVQVAIAQSVVPGELPNWGTTFAGATLASMPILVLFVFLQRYFIRGFVLSGLKG